MLEGQIININSNRYKVLCNDKEFICSARGKFRNDKVTPMVGDYVLIDKQNNQIIKILPRKNFLLRPNVANVDIALIITSVKKPNLDLYLLDKLLTLVTFNKIKPIICFTKIDLLNDEQLINFKKIRNYYEKIYDVIDNNQIEIFKQKVQNKIVVLCGQTGSGKSTFINKIDPSLNLKTNEISSSLGRGIHTTRMTTLYKEDSFYICDTPGFSSLDLVNIELEDLKKSFLEFNNYNCKFKDCNHINTFGCQIENNDNILKSRYENYTLFLKEINENRSKLFK
ncbi:MAG: ribosome small subunit-dependent GTPase A [bacterium]|nr:ribosome small subunit-dependent GTPase A [bacterium]